MSVMRDPSCNSTRRAASPVLEPANCPIQCQSLVPAKTRLNMRLTIGASHMANEWQSTEHALGYLKIADTIPHRTDGEAVLLDEVPKDARRILDLGSGDGRLMS